MLAQYLGMQILFMVLSGFAGMSFYSLHGAGVLWSFLLTWGLLLTAYSALCSTFFKSTVSSTSIVFLNMLVYVSVGGQIIFLLLQDPATTARQDFCREHFLCTCIRAALRSCGLGFSLPRVAFCIIPWHRRTCTRPS